MAYSFLDLAKEILKSASTPLTYQQIWEAAQDAGLTKKVSTKGKTPWQTLGARLYTEVNDNPNSDLIKPANAPLAFFSSQDSLSFQAHF